MPVTLAGGNRVPSVLDSPANPRTPTLTLAWDCSDDGGPWAAPSVSGRRAPGTPPVEVP